MTARHAKHSLMRRAARPALIAGGTVAGVVTALSIAPGVSTADIRQVAATPSPEDVTASATDSWTVQVISGGLNLKKTANRTNIFTCQRVTYTYTVTASGVPFRDVQVKDDKCAPVTGPTGDNGDETLTPGETWVYQCSQVLTSTTTNIGTVTGVPVLNAPSPSGTPSATPTPSPTAAGYKDGTYTGVPTTVTLPEVPGEVYTETVTVTIAGGVVSNATVAHSTIPNHTSLIIATDAEQQLTAQAIANNGKVSNISGATVTAKAFTNSLQDALTQATK